ncbi:hypothetical protein HRM2_17270 [Desulforapulum autotrophicum HRM2]|uniref:PEP-CTERM protein-sorting domain-containing protein n=1 Tax=Desulforapulum autotrophicum (strain ATCC 43914 / DSM 3382 / VKM B-1955 / HRM2) TaxID=177437 RepID=C0QB34_DESAH|nr:PEP-CTERM sorting domain-containing protein [Desulforapulum autotrophicum]ACN14833.1 hypothetical protein HRM2_17270 [Desulforapulum autotrophicum HRM2]
MNASDTNIYSDHVDVSIFSAGSYNIRYTWLNDQWAPEKGFDANIQIQNVFFDNQATIFNIEPISVGLLSVNNQATIPNPEPASLLLFGTGLMGLASFLSSHSAP